MKDSPIKSPCDKCSTNGEHFYCWDSDDAAVTGDSDRVYPRGTVLFSETQTPSGAYLLCGGHVKLSTSSGDARVLITDIAGPGYVLGLSAVVSGGAHEVSAETLEACRLVFVEREVFLGLLARHLCALAHATRQLSRIFGGSLDYAPNARLSLSGGYTPTRLTSDAEILYFAGLTGNRFATGRSQFYMRDQFFYFSAGAELHRRLTAYATYRVNNDGGLGRRLTNDAAGLFIRSLPFVYQTPEVRLSFKLARRVDWNVGYQYYAYREKAPFNTGQDYRAHLPYTSLRLYFGGRE